MAEVVLKAEERKEKQKSKTARFIREFVRLR